MNAAYELWETRTGNLMDSFESRTEALAVLADAIKRYGPSYADSIMLVYAYGEESKELSSGKDLAHWAMHPDR